jgi:hypothetical protein
VTSRIVPPPAPLDVSASLERIRAARAQAQAEQQQAAEAQAATQSANMDMNAESNFFHDTRDSVPSMEAARNMTLLPKPAPTPEMQREVYRAPGAYTEEQHSQIGAANMARRQEEQAWAQAQKNKKEDEAKAESDWNFNWDLDNAERQIMGDVDGTISGAVAEARPIYNTPIIAADKEAEKQEKAAYARETDRAETALAFDQKDFDNDTMEPDGTEPTDAPLPGEESLPPSIARWSSLRAARGMGGLDRLQRRYLSEVPEGSRRTMKFETWLATKGVNEETPYEVARGRLNLIADTKEGYDKSKGETVQVRTNTEVYARKKKQWLDTMAERYPRELAANPNLLNELSDSYDAGVKRGSTDNDGNELNDPHMAGVRSANAVVDGLRRGQKAQIAVNWKNRQDQMGRASTWGVPLAQVQFFDSLQNAKTPQEAANVLILAHHNFPAMGYDKAAALLMKGGLDNQALAQWAAGQNKPGGVDKFGSDLNAIQQGPIDGATVQRLRMAVDASIAPNTPPDQVKKIHLQAQQPIASAIANKPNKPNETEMMVLRQLTEGMSPEEFYEFTGLEDDPRREAIYREVFGKAPPTGFGQTLGNFASGIGDFIGGLFGQDAPSAAAWADQAGTGKPK